MRECRYTRVQMCRYENTHLNFHLIRYPSTHPSIRCFMHYSAQACWTCKSMHSSAALADLSWNGHRRSRRLLYVFVALGATYCAQSRQSSHGRRMSSSDEPRTGQQPWRFSHEHDRHSDHEAFAQKVAGETRVNDEKLDQWDTCHQ